MNTLYSITLICILYLLDMLFFVPQYTLRKYDHTPRTRKLMWKGACIGIPLLVLIEGVVYAACWNIGNLFLYVMTAGMFVCAVGDIILEIKFMRGGVFFLLGHIIYVIGLCGYVRKLTLVTGLVYLMMVALGTIITIDRLGKKYRVLLIIYNLVISASFAMGVTLILTNNFKDALVGVGACFLVVSDWLLGRNKLLGSNFSRSLVSLIFYFGGQCLISTMVFFL